VWSPPNVMIRGIVDFVVELAFRPDTIYTICAKPLEVQRAKSEQNKIR
jgi:hypothetical protein